MNWTKEKPRKSGFYITNWFRREINENWHHLLRFLVYMTLILCVFIDEGIHVFCAKPITEIKIGEAIFISIIILIFIKKGMK